MKNLLKKGNFIILKEKKKSKSGVTSWSLETCCNDSSKLTICEELVDDADVVVVTFVVAAVVEFMLRTQQEKKKGGKGREEERSGG